jgi:hypothetical protein
MKESAMELHRISESEAEERAERHLQKIHNAKRAIMKVEGLEDIEPVEDGRWEGDVNLNEAQADRIVAKADQMSELPSPEEVFKKESNYQN